MKGPLFVYALTILAISTGLFYPFIALMVYVAFAILVPDALWFYSLPSSFFHTGFGYSEAVAYPMIAGWIFRQCGNLNIGKATAPFIILVFFFIWAFFSSLATQWSSAAQEQLLAYVKLCIAMLIMLTLCEKPWQVRCLVWVIVLCSGFVAWELNWSYLNGFNRIHAIGFASMDNNFYAVSMVVGTTVAFFVGLSEKNMILKGIAFFSAVLQTHVVLISMSRGGMLALCVVGIVTFFTLSKNLTNFLLFTLALCAALYMAGDSVRERFFTAFEKTEDLDGSAQSRLKSWKACLKVVQQKPAFGVGTKNWTRVSSAYIGVHLEAHSMWLQTAVETGVPGFLSLLGFFLVVMWRMIPVARDKIPLPDPRMMYYGQMIIASLAGFCVAVQFVSVYAMEITFYVALVGMCILKLSKFHAEALEEAEYRTLLEEKLSQDRNADEQNSYVDSPSVVTQA